MPTANSGSEIKVLVVDDSAVVRQVLEAVLTQEPGISVTVASDPLIAQQKMSRVRPDVIVLDLDMPRMDGLTFLRRIMADDPIPTVICSGIAVQGTDSALRALDEGAIGIITKPQLGVRDFLYESGVVLLDMVRSAAKVRIHRNSSTVDPSRKSEGAPPRFQPENARACPDRVVAIGASTGGTEALTEILTSLPPDAPGIVVVQHMPAVFTAAFAQRLNRLSQVEVKEASHKDPDQPGLALIAPGNQHMSLRRCGGRLFVEIDDGPLVSRHRPSVDVLFRSVAQTAGPDALGIILTGMGSDGAQGLLQMREAGAETVAQDESSCVVFGMPKEAIARGAVEVILPLSRIPARILSIAKDRKRSRNAQTNVDQPL
jgi:two-component system chemotaxis response regulator CheB